MKPNQRQKLEKFLMVAGLVLIIALMFAGIAYRSNAKKVQCVEIGGVVLPSSDGWYCQLTETDLAQSK